MAGGQKIQDSQLSFEAGINFGLQPALIAQNQVWNAVNCIMRGGYLTNRPGYVYRAPAFDKDSAKTNFAIGNPQGIGYYQSQGIGYLILSLGGNLFAIDVANDFSASQIALPSPNPSDRPKAYMQQAADYFVIQDGESPPIYLNGLTATRVDTSKEYAMPVGGPMAYGWGRLWIASGNKFTAGDIVGGSTNVVTFSESSFLTGGGYFTLPSNMGEIRGMAFIPLQDTATGQGQLIVGADFGVGSVNGGIPREQWQTTQIQQVALLDVGWASHSGNALLNGDIMFRSYDGIRTYRMARAQQGINGNVPQSQEVFPYVSTDTQSLLRYGSAVNFDNRILFTTAPEWTGKYCIHKGLLSLDSYSITSLRGSSPPIWEGMWDGLDIVQVTKGIFGGKERCFALVRSKDTPPFSKVLAAQKEWTVTVNNTASYTEGTNVSVEGPGAGSYQIKTIVNGTTLTLKALGEYSQLVPNDSYIVGSPNRFILTAQLRYRFTVQDSSVFDNETFYVVASGYFRKESAPSATEILAINVGEYNDTPAPNAQASRGSYNEIWEITKNSPFDINKDGQEIRIESKILTRSFTYRDQTDQKQLNQFNMWVDNVVGTVDWYAKYRPDQYPCLFDWTSGQICSEDKTCQEVCPVSLTRHPTYRPRIIRGQPTSQCTDGIQGPSIKGYEFQLEIGWTGKMRIRIVRVECIDTTDNTRAESCP